MRLFSHFPRYFLEDVREKSIDLRANANVDNLFSPSDGDLRISKLIVSVPSSRKFLLLCVSSLNLSL